MISSNLLWALDLIPLGDIHRYEIITSDILAYHVTPAANVPDILAHGLQARSSPQSYDRPPAVYLVLDPAEIACVASILGLTTYAIIKVMIPRGDAVDHLVWDGLYNVSFSQRTAVQYLGRMPSDWVTLL